MTKKSDQKAQEAQAEWLLIPEVVAKIGDTTPRRVKRNAKDYGAIRETDKTLFVHWPTYVKVAAERIENPHPNNPRKESNPMARTTKRIEKHVQGLPEKIATAKKLLATAEAVFKLAESDYERLAALKQIETLEAKLQKLQAGLERDTAQLASLKADPYWAEEVQRKLSERGTNP